MLPVAGPVLYSGTRVSKISALEPPVLIWKAVVMVNATDASLPWPNSCVHTQTTKSTCRKQIKLTYHHGLNKAG